MTLTRNIGLDQLTEEEVKQYDKAVNYFKTQDTYLNSNCEAERTALTVDYAMRQVAHARTEEKYRR